eukprot:8892979-Heterocapsa_arctica.AAC.1
MLPLILRCQRRVRATRGLATFVRPVLAVAIFVERAAGRAATASPRARVRRARARGLGRRRTSARGRR